ncbi:ABC transporter permease [Nonomuraea mesophila]|uniref:ABC transporter permease n=1 Tax=Nonomuraea mesophila TaxID=2530382 RepID=A0A4R5ELW3_9ACTN|nr:ABC transporter permease [Nonomuraea mesophila]TDE35532.1 ABC transporter permease [Nonomuraea mesophila]
MTATVTPARRERAPLARARLVKFARHTAGVVGFLLLWQVLGMSGAVKWLPPAVDTLARTVALAVDPEFLDHVLGTLTAAVIGLPLAVLVAVPIGLVLGTVRVIEEMTRVFVEFLRPIPSVALIPLALFFFPSELNAKVALIVFAASWPILINTMYAMRDVDPVSKETLRTFGFGAGAVLWRVSLPSAAPFIATGVRLAASITLILAISVEYIVGGSTGIGSFLIQASTGIGADAMIDVLAALLWAGFLGLVVNIVLVRAERRLFRWRTT